MKNQLKFLILAIIITSFLFFPKEISALVVGEIMAPLEASLEGIEEKAGPIAALLLYVFFAYILSVIFAFVSAQLLEFATENPQWLSITENPMVLSGWHFTSGIANMFLILMLIFIAFAYIFKLETYEAKKSLIKLIVIAFLINFSLVFIGMLVDISNLVFQTILRENKDLPTQIVTALGGGAWGVVLGLIVSIIGLAVCFAVPLTAPFCQSGLVVGTVSLIFLPNVLIWFLQLFSFVLIGGMFFLYAFLFGARVFIIQLLAILSPLAFLCMILPQTKRYWEDWLKHLTEWLLLGIILFLFMVIGLNFARQIAPPFAVPLPIPPFNWIGLDRYFIYYFFLFVYLAVVLFISTKYAIPALAGWLIDQGKAIGGFMWQRGIQPVGTGAYRDLRRMAVEQRKREEEIKALEEKMKAEEKAGKVIGLKEKTAFWAKKTGLGFASVPFWAIRSFEKVRGFTPELKVAKEIENQAKNLEQIYGKDIKSAIEAHTLGGKLILSPEKRVAFAYYLQKVKGGKGLKSIEREELYKAIETASQLAPHMVVDIVKHDPELIDEKREGITKREERIATLIQNTLVPDKFEDKDVKKLTEIGVKQEDVIRMAAIKKAVDEIKTIADIENLTEEVINSKEFLKMVALFKPWSFIRAFGEERGRDYLEKLQDVVEKEITLKTLKKINPTFFRAPYSPLGEMLLRPWKKTTP